MATVAIIGRPNSGKSTLFNRMQGAGAFGSNSAITENTPGVTRDRKYAVAHWEGASFYIIDTGGFFLDDEFSKQVQEQAFMAIDEADVIIHLLDGKELLHPSDIELANILRQSSKPVLWAVNKIDIPAHEIRAVEFMPLGVDRLHLISASHGHGYDEFMNSLVQTLRELNKPLDVSEEFNDIPHIAVVGKPNVGKSTLINCLLGKNRHIVSPIAGTTRDAIDSVCSYYGKRYLFIDTAGIRKKSARYSIERYCIVRAIKSIERAHIALLVVDATAGITEQEQKIAGIIKEHGKGVIVLLNKWDIVEDPERMYKAYLNEIQNKLWFINYAPMLTISGQDKRRVTKIYPLIDEIMSERSKKISTQRLNDFLKNINTSMRLPAIKGKQIKFSYITQVGTAPPTFCVFTSAYAHIKDYHLTFLEKQLRAEFSFKGTPIRIFVKDKR